MVERPPVKRRVEGSSPSPGAMKKCHKKPARGSYKEAKAIQQKKKKKALIESLSPIQRLVFGGGG